MSIIHIAANAQPGPLTLPMDLTDAATQSRADETFTLKLDPSVPSVPEPSTALVAVFGAVAFIAYGWSRHHREQRRQAAP
jgi:hypothetical protein